MYMDLPDDSDRRNCLQCVKPGSVPGSERYGEGAW